MSIFKNLFGGGPKADLKALIDQGAFLVDVREPGEFAGGSVKGAINIPLGKIPAELSRFKGKENIVVFCRSGNRSNQAKVLLERNGIANVVNGGSLNEVKQFV